MQILRIADAYGVNRVAAIRVYDLVRQLKNMDLKKMRVRPGDLTEGYPTVWIEDGTGSIFSMNEDELYAVRDVFNPGNSLESKQILDRLAQAKRMIGEIQDYATELRFRRTDLPSRKIA